MRLYSPTNLFLILRLILCSVSEDEEKNIILLRLLEYLGHPNPYVCAVAYNEVSTAAMHHFDRSTFHDGGDDEN